eukprot:CAMPEP_0197073366 /NCGR_PEP_ID=MMETSP1384-20130603/210566_1 /TAXON_ID=29189 /ORGANISM="Ammonia sp." /LENGTH=503 /DNA_ID=CAMNT_0042512203 /DNA_START=77 /DNA_END=1588 /DNA_ORIENTATION=+
MDAEWSDQSLIPDLCKFIQCSAAISLRDIFVPNSNRRGCFSVKSRKIADKLLVSIANNNLSCRGRKPTAQITMVHGSNFRINLSNLNNVINSEDFVEWVKSINFDAFDIEISPVFITPPYPSHCILAFDTIDSAICVKQKLDEQMFGNMTLRFTHWHVPRRSSYPAVSTTESKPAEQHGQPSVHIDASHSRKCRVMADGQKLGIVLGLVDPNCGYSSTSTHSSPATNGPLYLRDAAVPPPPIRSPPPPPMQVRSASEHTQRVSGPSASKRLHLTIPPHSGRSGHAAVSRVNTPPLSDSTHRRHLAQHHPVQQKSRSATNTPLTQPPQRGDDFSALIEDFYFHDIVAVPVEEKQFAVPVPVPVADAVPVNTQYVESLRAEIERQKLYIEQVWKKNQDLESKVNALHSHNTRLNESYNSLYTKYVHLQQVNVIYRWSADEVIQWLLSVEHGRYYKYKDSFIRLVQQHNVTGSMLAKFTARELQGLGIFDQNDQYVLLSHIRTLVQ